MTNSAKLPEIFDYFISYKQKDSKEFVENLAQSIEKLKASVWVDQQQMRAGDSIFGSIQKGMLLSIDGIVIISHNYFSGWAKAELDALYNLMVAQRLRLIPVWYNIDHTWMLGNAPLLAGIVGIQAFDKNDAFRVARQIVTGFDPSQRKERLFYLFFRSVREHVADPDLDMFIATFEGKDENVRVALERGADPNITDIALWNRYNRIIIMHEDVWPAWRKLYLFLENEGYIAKG